MKRIVLFVRRIDMLSRFVGKLSGFLILASMALVIYEVVMRYALKLPTTWSSEMSQFLFGTFFALGGAYTLLHNGHVRMDIIYSRFTPKGKAIIDLATSIFFFIFLVVLLWKGSEFALRAIRLAERSDSAWGPFLWPTKIMIPIGAFLMLLQGLAKYADNIVTAIGRENNDAY